MSELFGLIHADKGYVGVASTLAAAAELFQSWNAPLVLCVDVPRCEYATCVMEAHYFFERAQKEGTNVCPQNRDTH